MLLEFEHVTGTEKQFRLEDVSFALPAGYIMGLAGKNGAGKSTLIDYIMNPKQRYTGIIRIDGVDIRKNHTAMRNWIGLVSDENPFLEERTAQQNAEMFGGLYQEWDMELFGEAMRKMEVPVSRTVGKMSRGERLKFQMAFAMAHHTKLYLLDEVTAGMDPVFRIEFFRMLGEVIAKEDVSVLMTSHVPEEIERKMDYVGVLAEGKLVSFGESIEVLGENTEKLENDAVTEISPVITEVTDRSGERTEGFGEEAVAGMDAADKTGRMTIAEFFHEFLSWRAESIGIWVGCGLLELLFIICMVVPVQADPDYELIFMAILMGGLGAIVYLQPYMVFMENGKSNSIYRKIKYFPVERAEVYRFRIKKLLRFLLIIIIPVGAIHLLAAQFAYGGICLMNVVVVIGAGFLLPFAVGALDAAIER